MNDDLPERIVQRAYTDFVTHRDVDAVLRYFTTNAQWHPVTPTLTRSSSLPIREYWIDCGDFLEGIGEGWTVHEQNVHAHGPFVISHLRTSSGEGVMIYRFEDGKISDIWAIHALGRDTPAVF